MRRDALDHIAEIHERVDLQVLSEHSTAVPDLTARRPLALQDLPGRGSLLSDPRALRVDASSLAVGSFNVKLGKQVNASLALSTFN